MGESVRQAVLATAMRRAVAASEAVRGTTSPNPPVGCVVLDAGGATAGVGATAQRLRLRVEEVGMSGPDIRISAVPAVREA